MGSMPLGVSIKQSSQGLRQKYRAFWTLPQIYYLHSFALITSGVYFQSRNCLIIIFLEDSTSFIILYPLLTSLENIAFVQKLYTQCSEDTDKDYESFHWKYVLGSKLWSVFEELSPRSNCTTELTVDEKCLETPPKIEAPSPCIICSDDLMWVKRRVVCLGDCRQVTEEGCISGCSCI